MSFKIIKENNTAGAFIGAGNNMWLNADTIQPEGYDKTTIPSFKVKKTGADAYDNFGYSVAVGSGRIVVGAYLDDNTGSAYVFDLDGNQIKKLTVIDAALGDYFGQSVAVGSDRIVVGVYKDDDGYSDSGSAYIFDLGGNELKKLTARDAAIGDRFGNSVAVGSGRIVVGAYWDDNGYSDSGSAYVFDLDGNQLTKLTAADAAANDYFGRSVAVGSGRIVVGAYGDDSDSGSAYVFDLDGNLIKKLTAIDAAGESDAATGDQFGYSVSVGSGRIVVGAYSDDNDDGYIDSGSAYVFDLDGNLIKKLTAIDAAGESDAAAHDRFGYSVSVGSGRIVVGAYLDGGSGSAYVFDLDGNLITKLTAIDAAGDYFGYSVAVDNGRIVVGSYLYDNVGGTDAGAAYVYTTPKNSTHILDIFD